MAAAIEEKIMMLGQIEVVTSLMMTKAGPTVTVRRTWKERLFTRPWQPLRATYQRTTQVPRTDAIMLNERTLMVHPAMLPELRKIFPTQ